MKRTLFTLGLFFLVGSSQWVNGKPTIGLRDSIPDNQFLQYEWIQFDAFWTKSNLWGKIKEREFRSRIYIHNIDSITQHVAIVGSRFASLVTPDTIFYIDHLHSDKGFFVRGESPNKDGETFYDYLAVDELQDELEYFPMYLNDCFLDVKGLVTLPTDKKDYTRFEDRIRIEASILQKHCYSDHCELTHDPLRLYYNPLLNLFDRGEMLLDLNYYGFSLSNFNFDDASSFLDSLFNLANHPSYDLCPKTLYVPSRNSVTNTTLNDTILNYPLVNLATGDTLTLASLQGWTLLYFGNFERPRYYRAMHEQKEKVDNIVWLMPFGNNTDMLRQMADSLHYGNDVYYTKNFHFHFSTLGGIYLIAPDHKTRFFTGGPFIRNPKNSLQKLMKNKSKLSK